MTIEKLVILCVTLAAYIGILVSIPIRRKKNCLSKGEAVSSRLIAILVLAPVIIGLLVIREFGTFVNIVFCMCALMSAHIAAKELCTKNQ